MTLHCEKLGVLPLMLSLCMILAASPVWAGGPEALDELAAAYRPQPHGYPTGKEYARPDSSVPFRWHFFTEQVVPHCEEATMIAHSDPFNPLEGEGVEVAKKSGIQFDFVAEHVTQGKRALRVTFPAQAVKTGQAI